MPPSRKGKSKVRDGAVSPTNRENSATRVNSSRDEEEQESAQNRGEVGAPTLEQTHARVEAMDRRMS